MLQSPSRKDGSTSVILLSGSLLLPRAGQGTGEPSIHGIFRQRLRKCSLSRTGKGRFFACDCRFERFIGMHGCNWPVGDPSGRPSQVLWQMSRDVYVDLVSPYPTKSLEARFGNCDCEHRLNPARMPTDHGCAITNARLKSDQNRLKPRRRHVFWSNGRHLRMPGFQNAKFLFPGVRLLALRSGVPSGTRAEYRVARAQRSF